jgi:hypothetical protein
MKFKNSCISMYYNLCNTYDVKVERKENHRYETGREVSEEHQNKPLLLDIFLFYYDYKFVCFCFRFFFSSFLCIHRWRVDNRNFDNTYDGAHSIDIITALVIFSVRFTYLFYKTEGKGKVVPRLN